MSPAQLFAFADAARDRGDFALAERAYRALATNPSPELRAEARFRLGMMLADRMGRPRDAAVEFRRILDEKPDAVRVRLELARIQAKLGRLGDARRELRAAEAAGLPPRLNAWSASMRPRSRQPSHWAAASKWPSCQTATSTGRPAPTLSAPSSAISP